MVVMPESVTAFTGCFLLRSFVRYSNEAFNIFLYHFSLSKLFLELHNRISPSVESNSLSENTHLKYDLY